MANKATASEEQDNSSLVDFKFDDDASFFGIKDDKVDNGEQVIKEVKSDGSKTPKGQQSTNIQDKPSDEDDEPIEEEDDDNEVTFFEDKKPAKSSTKEETNEDEEEDDDNKEVEDKKVKPEKDKPKAKQETKEEVKEDEEEGDEEDDTPNEDEKKDDEFFTTLAKELKEKGVFSSIELKDGQKVTEDEFFELQDKELEARVDETFQAFFEEMDEDGKRFLQFKKNGGRTQDFLATYSNGILPLDTLDEDNEAQRSQVLTHYLTTVEKLDADELSDRLTYLKDSGKEKAYAIKYFNSIKDNEKKIKEALVKQQEDKDKKRQDDAAEFNNALVGVINVTDAVGAFTFTKEDQKNLGAYITKPTVKVGKNKYAPNFQVSLAKILRAETVEDKQKLMVLAKLVKDDFDISDLAASTTTKVAKKTKSKLAEVKKGVKPGSSSGSGQKKSLSDYFES